MQSVLIGTSLKMKFKITSITSSLKTIKYKFTSYVFWKKMGLL